MLKVHGVIFYYSSSTCRLGIILKNMDVCLFQKWLVATTVNSKLTNKKSTLVTRKNIYNINMIIHYIKKQTIKKLN